MVPKDADGVIEAEYDLEELLRPQKPAWSRGYIMGLGLVLILSATASFGLGRLSVRPSKTPITIEQSPDISTNFLNGIVESAQKNNSPVVTQSATEANTKGEYVGSKNSDKYHLPWCPGAQRIKDENKVWFASKAAAEKAGYVPASNCPGM